MPKIVRVTLCFYFALLVKIHSQFLLEWAADWLTFMPLVIVSNTCKAIEIGNTGMISL